MMIQPQLINVDKSSVSRSFGTAAKSYDAFSALQKTVGLTLLPLQGVEKKVVLDLGCGTGFFMPYLTKLFDQATIAGVDISPGMLSLAKANNPLNELVCADAYKLPFDNHSVDLIYSNLMFQWCDDLLTALTECRRVLRLNRDLCFSTLTKNTMRELHQSWASVSAKFPLMRFDEASEIESAVRSAGFQSVRTVSCTYNVFYHSVSDFFKAMKRLGSKNHLQSRGRGLLTERILNKVTAAYEEFRTDEGLLPVTYEVLYVYAS